MHIAVNILITLSAFLFMEFMAWFTHKYVMHGFMWKFHYDHHNGSKGFFEKNDVFFLIFAIPGCLFCVFGSLAGFDWKFYIGIGITFYGMAYFLVHDVLIHQRFKWFKNSNNLYLKAIRRAHRAHHSHLGKERGESFGMLLVGKKYYDMVKQQR